MSESSLSSQVVTITIVEKLLLPEDMPSDFECSGFETHLEKGVVSTKTNVYGAELELRNPERMRFDSQAKNRTYRSLDSVRFFSLHF